VNDDTMDDPLTAGMRSLQYGDISDPNDRANVAHMVCAEAMNAAQAQREQAEIANGRR
jgi:hypothetical protein